MTDTHTQTSNDSPFVFSFGDPEPILNIDITDYQGLFLDISGDYYRPPIDLKGLIKLTGANAYHGPILHFKKNLLKLRFHPTPLLNQQEFGKLVLNYLVMGNGYLQKLTNRFKRTTRLINQPALPLRRAKEQNRYLILKDDGRQTDFKEGEIIHLAEYDLRQSIYGMPEYFGGIQAVLLSEESTLFRRKYYLNGAHMGYILVASDANIDDKTAKLIETQVKNSKGPGNFRSLFVNIGRTNSKEPIKIIPVGDIGTKDEFERIKAITEREMLAMHRMQPGLSGIIPQNTGGFGDLEKVMRVYHEFEVKPLQNSFLAINDLLGEEVIRFNDPIWW